MKTITKFTADDGTEFDSREACEAHEAGLVEQKLVGLTIEQVRDALARNDVGLADAIEALGQRITKVRLEAGARRRAVKPAEAAAPGTSAPAPGSTPSPASEKSEHGKRKRAGSAS